MTGAPRQVVVGRVGRAHGLDGKFYLETPARVLEPGEVVIVGGREMVVERVAGSRARPLVRLDRVSDRGEVAAIRGEAVAVLATSAELALDEYFSADLLGCVVEGLGSVRRVIAAPSCDLLEVGEEELLIPFVRDAIKRIDPAAGVIEVDRRFLGLA